MPLPLACRRAVLGFACALLAHAAAGQETFSPQSSLADADAQLRQGEWLQARASALRLIERNRTRLLASELAGPVARLALAEAGWGHEDAAIWHWHVAQNLDRSVLSPDALASFGKAGELLARHPLRKAGAAPAGLTVAQPDTPGVHPGRRVEGAIPRLSAEVEALPAPKTLRLEAVVGADGRLSDPVVVAGGVPGMIYEVLESLRDWRYEPARRDGEAVAVFRAVSVNLPVETPFARLAPLPGERAEAERLLRAREWRSADRLARKLWEEALNTPGNTPRDLAALLSLRALAEAGLGEDARAVCRWHAAQHLNPALYSADLSSYGPAGDLLEKNRWGDVAPASLLARGAAVQERDEVEIPKASRVTGLEGTVVLAAIVGPDGGVRQPLLLRAEATTGTIGPLLQGWASASPGNPAAVYASRLVALSALDGVCDWRFRAGEPAYAQTVLTVPFKIKAPYLGGAVAVYPTGPNGIGHVGPPYTSDPLGSRRDPLTPDPALPPGHTPPTFPPPF